MPEQNKDLHGNVPDTADIALVLIDVINDFEFEGGEDSSNRRCQSLKILLN